MQYLQVGSSYRNYNPQSGLQCAPLTLRGWLRSPLRCKLTISTYKYISININLKLMVEAGLLYSGCMS